MRLEVILVHQISMEEVDGVEPVIRTLFIDLDLYLCSLRNVVAVVRGSIARRATVWRGSPFRHSQAAYWSGASSCSVVEIIEALKSWMLASSVLPAHGFRRGLLGLRAWVHGPGL